MEPLCAPTPSHGCVEDAAGTQLLLTVSMALFYSVSTPATALAIPAHSTATTMSRSATTANRFAMRQYRIGHLTSHLA